MDEARSFERERQIVAAAVGLPVSVTYAMYGFSLHIAAPAGTIRIDVGTAPTVRAGSRSLTIPLDGNPPLSPLIESLEKQVITAARLTSDVLELEFGSTLVQVPHTPDLWSFSIGVNFGEGHPLSGLWFF